MYCDCEKEEFTKDQVWMWKGRKVEESKAAKKKKEREAKDTTGLWIEHGTQI